jgi:hypothetical protein
MLSSDSSDTTQTPGVGFLDVSFESNSNTFERRSVCVELPCWMVRLMLCIEVISKIHCVYSVNIVYFGFKS